MINCLEGVQHTIYYIFFAYHFLCRHSFHSFSSCQLNVTQCNEWFRFQRPPLLHANWHLYFKIDILFRALCTALCQSRQANDEWLVSRVFHSKFIYFANDLLKSNWFANRQNNRMHSIKRRGEKYQKIPTAKPTILYNSSHSFTSCWLSRVLVSCVFRLVFVCRMIIILI